MELAWCTDKGLPHSELLAWSLEDRNKLHAYLLEEGTRCALCGTQPWEWEENKRAYVAVEHFCMGCYVKQGASEGVDATNGITIELRPYSSALVEKMAERHRLMLQKKRDVKDGTGE